MGGWVDSIAGLDDVKMTDLKKYKEKIYTDMWDNLKDFFYKIICRDKLHI
jgi:hypothetical protein